jgi:hypothetical protein
MVVKPYVLCKEIGYNLREIKNSILKCIQVSVVPILISIGLYIWYDIDGFFSMLTVAVIICVSVLFSSYVCLEKSIRAQLNKYIYSRIVSRL